jgi:hypothetical protein
MRLGADVLKELKPPVKMMVGEHDWFLDMGNKWQQLFGPPSYSFDWKGVHVITLMSVNEKDFWTARHMSADERMHTVAGLDNGVQSRFEVGDAVRQWLTNLSRQGHHRYANPDLFAFAALQILPPVEFLDRGCRLGSGHPKALQDRDRYPRPYASIVVQPDRQHLVPRHAVDGLALALRARGSAKADDPDGQGGSVRSVRCLR